VITWLKDLHIIRLGWFTGHLDIDGNILYCIDTVVSW